MQNSPQTGINSDNPNIPLTLTPFHFPWIVFSVNYYRITLTPSMSNNLSFPLGSAIASTERAKVGWLQVTRTEGTGEEAVSPRLVHSTDAFSLCLFNLLMTLLHVMLISKSKLLWNLLNSVTG